MFFQYSQYIFYKILKELVCNQSLFIRLKPTNILLANAKSVNEKSAYKSVCLCLDVFWILHLITGDVLPTSLSLRIHLNVRLRL